MKRFVIAVILIAAVLVSVFSFTACTPEQRQEFINRLKDVTIVKYTTETYTYVIFEDIKPTDITFTSSNEDVATVAPGGVITAVNIGIATITATYGTDTDSIIFISKYRGIKVAKKVGDKLNNESIMALFADYPQVINFSLDELNKSNLATLEEDGNYTFNSAGETYIDGYYEGTKVFARIEITITNDKV